MSMKTLPLYSRTSRNLLEPRSTGNFTPAVFSIDLFGDAEVTGGAVFAFLDGEALF